MGEIPGLPTPEHDKLIALDRERDGAARLWEWLREHGYTLCLWDGRQYDEANLTASDAIGAALGVDPARLADEKHAILQWLRAGGVRTATGDA